MTCRCLHVNETLHVYIEIWIPRRKKEKKGLPQIGFVNIIWGSEYHEFIQQCKEWKILKKIISHEYKHNILVLFEKDYKKKRRRIDAEWLSKKAKKKN